MKLSIVGGILLLLTLVFFSFGLIIDDMNTNYGNTTISPTGEFNTSLISDFNDVEALNASIAPIQRGWEQVSKAEGFLDIIGNFAIVLPKAIVSVPSVLFTIAVLGKQRLEDVLVLLGIPPEVIVIALTALAIFVVFAVVGWWQRRDI